MSNQLFSQIPASVLSRAKVNIYGVSSDDESHNRKKVRFHDDVRASVIKTIETSDEDTIDLDVEDISDEPPTSSNSIETNQSIISEEKKVSDAIIQVDFKVKTVNQETQTDDSLFDRSLTDYEQQRMNSQKYFAMYSMPKAKRTIGGGPQLKIGLTMRGKKRKVYYPDEENDF